MTEKRFKITDDGIVDTVRLKQYKKIKSSDNILDSISFTHLIDVVNLLNKLNDENKQLKQAYNDAKKDVEKKEQILEDIMKDNLLIQDIRKELEND